MLSAVLLDRVGRKPLLIISAIGSSVGMLSVGVFFYLKHTGSAEVGHVFVCVCVTRRARALLRTLETKPKLYVAI